MKIKRNVGDKITPDRIDLPSLAKFFFLLVLLSSGLLSRSQVYLPGDFHDPIDKLNDSTILSFYESVKPLLEDEFSLNDVYYKTTYVRKYARGYNDGAVWKGVGLTSELHGGVSGRIGKMTYILNPVLFFTRNGSYNFPNLQSSTSEFAYPYSSRIDWVQRFGDDPFSKFHLGQSELRLDLGKVVTSIGTQNYSLGPSMYNPIMLSRQAGGFPHLRIGIKPSYLSKKKSVAKVEANLLFGLLKESDYFDFDPDNDTRYLNGLAIAIVPSFLPNVKIGFNKFLYKQTRYFQKQDLFSTLFIIDDGVINGDTLSPNDTFDQMASFTFEWNFREVGFRAYMEFAKNDFTSGGGGLRPTAVEPEHSRGYTIGFEKIIRNKNDTEFMITYEHTNLSIGHAPWRATPSFYAHDINRQGYTHDGQIIGAGIGPGGNSDHLGIRMNKGTFSSYFLLQRIERDRDYFVTQIRSLLRHNIEYSSTLALQMEFNKLDFFAEATYSYNYSWNYVKNDIWNMTLGFGGRFKFGL